LLLLLWLQLLLMLLWLQLMLLFVAQTMHDIMSHSMCPTVSHSVLFLL
jgi:hypothetical protein